MKIIVMVVMFGSFLFSSDLILKEVIFKCSKLQNSEARLACFDNLAKATKPNSEEMMRAKILIQGCTSCHGERWDIPTRSGSQAVRHMTQEKIKQSLLMYKENKRVSAIMQKQMVNRSQADIELMSKYIAKSARETR